MLEHSAQRVGVRLEKACEDDTPSVLGDSADLRQVVFNLVKNAIDASSEGGVVRIRTGSQEGRVTLEVEDEGTGVTVEPLEKVFEPFVTTKDPGKGTGLGLAISHRIVTDHGGSIRVRNRDVRGARFTVELPALL
jgi:signal transduction histidine kinase